MREQLDTFFAWLIMFIGCGHALSVFYFFQPIIEPHAAGVRHEAALWWVAGGINQAIAVAGLHAGQSIQKRRDDSIELIRLLDK
jgi:hypothetical protein